MTTMHDTAATRADLRQIARRLEAQLRASRRPAITDAIVLDIQALCVAEEAGSWSARTAAGRARPAAPAPASSWKTR